jgi:hypothetical protein
MSSIDSGFDLADLLADELTDDCGHTRRFRLRR